MSADYRTWSLRVRELDRHLAALADLAGKIGVPPPAGQGWFELLRRKLLPQLDLEPLLVVGIVGGTNIGKSLLFNHLAGEIASGVTPLAAGTKHPVCLVPPGLDDPALLGRLFEGFELLPWASPEDPMQESARNLLFWRVGQRVPSRLLLLDAPDVDSDVAVNWGRARAIRQAADVLVAVLTQQKYNDAAVKQFFREAVQADKPIVVLFNQVDLRADQPYWPQWLATFCSQTGAEPELVYVIPLDRSAADLLSLPFYPVGPDGRQPPQRPASLREELAALHFDAIKIRTFRGALRRLLDPQEGAPAYFRAIRQAASQFAAAQGVLCAGEMARVSWPPLPAGLLVEQIRAWWDAARSPWSRSIHGFYRRLGEGIKSSWRWIWGRPGAGLGEPGEAFRRQEREAVVWAVQKMLEELERLAQVANPTLRPRLAALLKGTARQQVLDRVAAAHQQLPAIDEDYRAFLRAELDGWKRDRPGVVRFLQSLDNAAAIARPAITVLLLVSGWHLAGSLAIHAAGHGVVQLAQEAAIAGGIAGGGEALLASTSERLTQAAARLLARLQSRYAQQRAAWLAGWLEKELLGDLLAELRGGAEVPQSEPFRQAEKTLEAIRAATGGNRIC
ncbi:MAG: GTPase [Thermoguttaceae bacterium]